MMNNNMHAGLEWTGLSEELINLTRLLVDEKLGIVKNLYEKATETDEPPAYIFNAQCCSPLYLNRDENAVTTIYSDVHATGCAWNREDALWATLGESLERYSSYCWQQFDLLRASYLEIANKAIPIEKFILFSDEQYERQGFRWCRFDATIKHSWHQGIEIGSNRQIYIPAVAIWLDFIVNKPQEYFFPQISTGLACGSCAEQVIHGGLKEVIERDAFACHWCLSAEPPAIVIDAQIRSLLTPAVIDLIDNPNFLINVRWITTEIDIPVVFVLIRSVHHEGTTVGAACHPNAASAIDKAITEAIHGWKWLNDLRRDSTPITNKEEVIDFKSHVRYYISDDNISNLSHYQNDHSIELESRYLNASRDWKEGIELMNSALNAQGFTSYYADITPEDVASLGFTVGKIITPGLQPLAAGQGNEHFDTRRLKQFANWKNISEFTLCLEPHPFP